MSEIRSQATPARDELAEIIASRRGVTAKVNDIDRMVADRILTVGWSKPRTVNSAAELDALPVESVIAIDGYPKAYFKQSSTLCWAPIGRTTPAYLTSRGLLGGDLPSRTARVLFTPGGAG